VTPWHPVGLFLRCYNAAMSDERKPSSGDRIVSGAFGLHGIAIGVGLMLAARLTPFPFDLVLVGIGAALSWSATTAIIKAIKP
jgi:urea transporter